MGCDIHIIVERQSELAWERVWSHDYDKPDADESQPRQWCGGISGAGVLVVMPEQLLTEQLPFTHVRITWTETAREATGDWIGQVLPWLESLSDGRPLRLVFGFDS